MAAQVVDKLPVGQEWSYELKFDGYRALILKTGNEVQIRSRNDRHLTRMYPSIVTAAKRMRATDATVDGEIVALDERGRPSFQALQHRTAHPAYHIVFYAFDLLHLEGEDFMSRPLTERRAALPDITRDSGILLSQDLPGTPDDIVQSVSAMGLEGVIAKHRSSLYLPGERSSDWQKLKLEPQQEFVIGGYRPAGNAIDALLVGYYEGKELHFAAKVRAGFVPHLRRQVFEKLQPLKTDRCPFVDLPSPPGSSRWGGGVPPEEMKDMRWVRPETIAQVRFTAWTAEGRLRLPKFLGLRTDKTPREVRRE